ncbi:MAG: sigma-70 family RNA polymerase sigma factor [Oscillospiraceae bacterium]|nr:sigma-70 family RNA polymerase sigma factor [Oscillospiraceae bacterium]
MKNYNELPDGRLALLVREKDEKALAELIARLMPAIRAKTLGVKIIKNYALEFDDLLQESMLAILSAAYSYDPAASEASFRTYAGVCISNRIATLIKNAAGKKQVPLNDYIALDESLASDTQGLEEKFIAEDELQALKNILYNNLSAFEYEAAKLYLSGYCYREIAAKLGNGATEKSVDNALQRVRRKLKCIIHNA